jgi:endonuclease/exonuclease/phosphatase family metal-dependent hydrolase
MELTLITCNIRFDNPDDGANSWAYRRNFLTQTLLAHTPSIIATQEGRFNQLTELNSSLPIHKIIDHHRSWIAERMYPTLFMNNSLFEFLGSGDLWLSETPEIAGSFSFESSFPRLMTWSHLQIKDSTHRLFIVNTHLDHVKQETRLKQTEVMINQINKYWDQKSFLIIMGDFNDHPNSPVRKIIENEYPFLTDSWKSFNSIEECSHHGFKGVEEHGSRIDWILTPKDLEVILCKLDKSHQQGKFPSDHFPVVCKIKL